MFCSIKSYNVFECCLLALTQPHNRFATLLLPCRCSKSAQKSAVQVYQVYCCYGNHTTGSKLILKLCIVVNGELNRIFKCEK